MTDNKLTDEQIIKALGCCKDLKCSECPKKTNLFKTDCDVKLCDEAIDLINRQKAEIEKLNIEIKAMRGAANSYKSEVKKLNAVSEICGDCHKQYAEKIEKAKTEVIKEFADRLKKEAVTKCNWDECVDVEDIDNLVKEMLGKEDEGK